MMRFIIANEFYQQMLQQPEHTVDCYVRPGEYLHHMYIDGVKYAVAPAVLDCLAQAERRATRRRSTTSACTSCTSNNCSPTRSNSGASKGVTLLGDPPPTTKSRPRRRATSTRRVCPPSGKTWDWSLPFLFDMVLRVIFNRGQISGSDIADMLAVPYPVIGPLLTAMRKQTLIDIAGQRHDVYIPATRVHLRNQAAEGGRRPAGGARQDELRRPAAGAVHGLRRGRAGPDGQEDHRHPPQHPSGVSRTSSSPTRCSTRSARPSTRPQSIFFFGYPGNGKTSIAERITRLDGRRDLRAAHGRGQRPDHQRLRPDLAHAGQAEETAGRQARRPSSRRRRTHDRRFIKVKRPTIVTGGELTMPMLDLRYNSTGKYYEAPLQMKANGGIFMIDDFGRQQVRPMDLLNRWIVPLEKRYDYLNTATGTKIEVPFDEILIFSHEPRPEATGGRSVPAADQVQDRNPRPGRGAVPTDLGTRVQEPKRVDFDEAG